MSKIEEDWEITRNTSLAELKQADNLEKATTEHEALEKAEISKISLFSAFERRKPPSISHHTTGILGVSLEEKPDQEGGMLE